MEAKGVTDQTNAKLDDVIEKTKDTAASVKKAAKS